MVGLQGFLAFVWLAPVLWMVSTAIKREGTILQYPIQWIPPVRNLTLENFQLIVDNFPIFRWYLNDMISAGCATILVLITGSMAGYAFARVPFRFKELVFFMLMLALLVPPEVTFIPLFLAFSSIGLGNTYPALFLPLVANAFALFLFREFFEQLPLELEDAARVDGASRWQVYLRIVLPLSAPVLVAVAILTFMSSWNNFMWPLIIAGTDETKTLPVGMNQFAPAGGMSSVGYGLTMAGTTIVATPALLVFLLLSRQFMRGVSFTGLKG
jgi:ABC-type glycerol-3-phosphate transport system permease component